jgi:D-cysteine desulfhydrase
VTPADLREALSGFPSLPLVAAPTLVEPMPRLSAILGGGPRLFIKRDDAIPFGFGGNKVRKLALVAARAAAENADTLVTAGGVQSNHARATAAAAARLGMRAVLVANGSPPARKTANALLDELLGAEVVYVASREARAPKIQEIAERLRRAIEVHSFLQGQGLTARISASFGISSYPDHALTPEGLIQKADQAMYRVKERDKNGIEVAV